MPVVRTRSAAGFDPSEVKSCVVTGYCGVDNAELRRVRAGDLGRSETGAFIAPSHRRVRIRDAAGPAELMGLQEPPSVLT
jgi:hypothetical protein